jgi:hypothetical protein
MKRISGSKRKAKDKGPGTESEYSKSDDVVLEAIRRRTTYDAERTRMFLRVFFPGVPISAFSREMLIELTALSQIAIWEKNGVLPLLSSDLPDLQSALTDFEERLEAALDNANIPMETVLAVKVFDVLENEIALDAMNEMQVDVVIDQNIDDSVIDALASFFWANRAELELLTNGGTDEFDQ